MAHGGRLPGGQACPGPASSAPTAVLALMAPGRASTVVVFAAACWRRRRRAAQHDRRADVRVGGSPASSVWRGFDEVPSDLGPTVVTIGVFDGVHRGHRVILARALAAARTLGAERGSGPLPVVVVTFDPHPSEVVRAGTHPAMLSTVAHRAELLEERARPGSSSCTSRRRSPD